MTQRIPVVVVALVLLGAVPATAQTAQQERLKGVTEAYVLIENIHDDSASCGITETGLTTAASKALLDNGVRVAGARIGPTLIVNVNTMYFEEGNPECVSIVEVELYSSLSATPEHSAQPLFGKFVLAGSGGMNASPRDEHGQRIRDAVFDYVEAIAVDIRIANQ